MIFDISNSIFVEYLSEYILDHRHNWIRPGRRKLHLLMELKDYIVLKDYEHDYILQNYQYIYKFVKNKIPETKPPDISAVYLHSNPHYIYNFVRLRHSDNLDSHYTS